MHTPMCRDEAERLLQAVPLATACDRLDERTLRVQTPFRYPDGGLIDLYLVTSPDLLTAESTAVRVTDLGDAAAWLHNLNLLWHRPRRRRQLVEAALRALEVEEEDGALCIDLPPGEAGRLPEAVLRLAQAVIRVTDLCYTARFRAGTPFSEEVETFLTDLPLDYEAGLSLRTPFGNEVTIEYVVRGPRSQSWLTTLSGGNPSAAESAAQNAFRRWYDLQRLGAHERNGTQFITVCDAGATFRAPDLARLADVSRIVHYPSEQDILRDILMA